MPELTVKEGRLPELHLPELTREDILAARKPRQRRVSGEQAKKVARVRCAMTGGVSVVFAKPGDGVSLGVMIDTVSELLRELKKANDLSYSAQTFEKMLKDRNKVNTA